MTFAEDFTLIQREVIQLFLIDIGRDEFKESTTNWPGLFQTQKQAILEDSDELKEVYHQILIEKNQEASDIFRETKLKLWDIQRDKHIEESLFMGLKLYL